MALKFPWYCAIQSDFAFPMAWTFALNRDRLVDLENSSRVTFDPARMLQARRTSIGFPAAREIWQLRERRAKISKACSLHASFS